MKLIGGQKLEYHSLMVRVDKSLVDAVKENKRPRETLASITEDALRAYCEQRGIKVEAQKADA